MFKDEMIVDPQIGMPQNHVEMKRNAVTAPDRRIRAETEVNRATAALVLQHRAAQPGGRIKPDPQFGKHTCRRVFEAVEHSGQGCRLRSENIDDTAGLKRHRQRFLEQAKLGAGNASIDDEGSFRRSFDGSHIRLGIGRRSQGAVSLAPARRGVSYTTRYIKIEPGSRGRDETRMRTPREQARNLLRKARERSEIRLERRARQLFAIVVGKAQIPGSGNGGSQPGSGMGHRHARKSKYDISGQHLLGNIVGRLLAVDQGSWDHHQFGSIRRRGKHLHQTLPEFAGGGIRDNESRFSPANISAYSDQGFTATSNSFVHRVSSFPGSSAQTREIADFLENSPAYA